jgi:hypothetical protein
MFGPKKVECDGCNTMIKQRGAILHRGSYFCNPTCRDVWSKKNPPRMATGDPATLRHNLAHTIDTALDEYQLSMGGDSVEQVLTALVPIVGRTNARIDDQVRHEHSIRFAQYTHECIPLLHGLGYVEEAAIVETLGFGGQMPHILGALHRARARARS